MSGLLELPNVRQVQGERRRRWFRSDDMDLIVWLDDSDRPVSFQLCYDRGRCERALTCAADGSLSHAIIDDGEVHRNNHKETPVLVASPNFDAEAVMKQFMAANHEIPAEISNLVLEKLQSCLKQ